MTVVTGYFNTAEGPQFAIASDEPDNNGLHVVVFSEVDVNDLLVPNAVTHKHNVQYGSDPGQFSQ